MRRFRSMLLATFALTMLAWSPPSRAIAWPWFLLITGPGLSTPVVIGRSAMTIKSDIIRLYASFTTEGVPNGYSTRPHFDVAEFWGPDWMPLPNGGPPRTLRYDEGSPAATIYHGTSATPAVWVGRTAGADGAVRVIGDSGVAILRHAGVVVR